MKKLNFTLRFLLTLILLAWGVDASIAQWIRPARYQEMLGSGIDVDWWTDASLYSGTDWATAIADFRNVGIQHVRITLTDDLLSPSDFQLLDRQVNYLLQADIVPIIACKPRIVSGRSPAWHHRHITDWWDAMAYHYQNYPSLLSFDILLEPSATLFSSYTLLNDFYEDCVATIRSTNPCRILFIAPSAGSDPLYLHHLRIPSHANGYLMAEWHFLNRSNYERAWNDWQHRRSYGERWINSRIEAALDWQRRTGIYTWIGGSYFGFATDAAHQSFHLYLTNAFHRARLPFAVRGIHRYYDYHNLHWQQTAMRPMQTIFPRHNFARQGQPAPSVPHAPSSGFSISGRHFNGSPSLHIQQPQKQSASGFRIQDRPNNENHSRIQTGGNGRSSVQPRGNAFSFGKPEQQTSRTNSTTSRNSFTPSASQPSQHRSQSQSQQQSRSRHENSNKPSATPSAQSKSSSSPASAATPHPSTSRRGGGGVARGQRN